MSITNGVSQDFTPKFEILRNIGNHPCSQCKNVVLDHLHHYQLGHLLQMQTSGPYPDSLD